MTLIDVLNDELLCLKDAARTLPGDVSATSLWRWCTHGVMGIRLAHTRVGRRIFVNSASLSVFCQQTAQAHLDAIESRRDRRRKLPRTTSAARRRSLAEADRVLAEAGIGTRRGGGE